MHRPLPDRFRPTPSDPPDSEPEPVRRCPRCGRPVHEVPGPDGPRRFVFGLVQAAGRHWWDLVPHRCRPAGERYEARPAVN